MNKIYTGKESWIYAYAPETKEQLTVGIFQGESNITKVIRACKICIKGCVATVQIVNSK